MLQDLRLLFKMKQQQFVEELRQGAPDSTKNAIGVQFLLQDYPTLKSVDPSYTPLVRR